MKFFSAIHAVPVFGLAAELCERYKSDVYNLQAESLEIYKDLATCQKDLEIARKLPQLEAEISKKFQDSTGFEQFHTADTKIILDPIKIVKTIQVEFFQSPRQFNFPEAVEFCENYGLKIAVPADTFENDLITNYMHLTQTIDFWIGLMHNSASNKQDINLVTSDQKFNFASMEYVWASTPSPQPNGGSVQCMFIHGFANPKYPSWGIGWHDIGCSFDQIYALCERRVEN